jgi:hypothetical protein
LTAVGIASFQDHKVDLLATPVAGDKEIKRLMSLEEGIC